MSDARTDGEKMSRGATGFVKSDGASILPGGIYDMAELGENLTMDPEIERKLAETFKDAVEDAGIKAKYKLEVAFTEYRSTHKPFAGLVSAWSNGGFMHGGGDEAIYFCTAKIEKDGRTRACASPIDLRFLSKKAALCPSCRRAVRPSELQGQTFARLPMQHWATLITRHFTALGCDADIRMGHLDGDLHQATRSEQDKNQHGERLFEARVNRRWIVYPLRNIVKDTSAGADLYTRVRSFLSA